MPAYTNDDGTQTITFDYLQNATSVSFNTLLRGIMKAGIYEGGLLSRVDDVTVSISPYTAIVYASNDDTVAVRVETQSSYNVTISSTNTVVVLRYEWYDQVANFVQAIAVTPASVLPDDIVVGLGSFSGSVLSGTFVYDDPTYPREAVSQDADTIYLGSSFSIDSDPTIGTSAGAKTASTFNGATTFIVDVLEDVYNRLIDLSGVRDSSVYPRHLNLGITDGLDAVLLKLGGALSYVGSSPGTIVNTTAVTTALQNIINLISDLSGASNDSVTRRLINFGTASDEISLKDFIIGIAGSQAMDGSFTDYSYTQGTAINSALNSLSSILNEVATLVNTNASSLSSLTSTVGGINAKNNLEDLPVGVIMMYSGTSWNPSLLPGTWQVCDGSNGTPDLVDKFVKGAASLDANPANNVAGAATVTLDSGYIPEHGHTFAGTVSGNTGSDGIHSHTPDDPGHFHTVTGRTTVQGAGALTAATGSDKAAVTSNTDTKTTGITIEDSDGHTHTFSGSFNGTTGNYGEASPTAISINPRHYKLIFIIKTA